MRSRLFHAIVVCGAALGCGSETGGPEEHGDGAAELDAGLAPVDSGTNHEERCRLADGGCHEHCSRLADGSCLDPCFVHTETCSPDCLLLDGTCGWPPTK
jgi:hypothetical protein